MQLDNTPEVWEQLQEKFKELYHLVKSPDWTEEEQERIYSEIQAIAKFLP